MSVRQGQRDLWNGLSPYSTATMDEDALRAKVVVYELLFEGIRGETPGMRCPGSANPAAARV